MSTWKEFSRLARSARIGFAAYNWAEKIGSVFIGFGFMGLLLSFIPVRIVRILFGGHDWNRNSLGYLERHPLQDSLAQWWPAWLVLFLAGIALFKWWGSNRTPPAEHAEGAQVEMDKDHEETR